jgi:hypothetical protein
MDERTKPADQHDHESMTRSGEEVANTEQEAGRKDGPDKSQTARPTGTSTARDYTGVNPLEAVTKDDPAG